MGASSEGSIQLTLLGTFAAIVDGEPVDDSRWPRRKARQVLQLLAISPRRQLHQEQAMESLWPEVSPSSAANNLNKAIHMARHALEPELTSGNDSRFIARNTSRLILQVPEDSIDVLRFERQAAAALNGEDPAAFEGALSMYEGDLLPEDLYADWAQPRREQLQAVYVSLLLDVAGIYTKQGRPQAAHERLTELLTREPANERAHRQMMQAQVQLGQRDAALRQYQRCCEALAEFGAEPDEPTESLHGEILAGRVTAPVLSGATAAFAGATDDTIQSLAVLPLTNTTQNENIDYLCQGVSESVINRLSQVPRLRVMALSTVLRIQGEKNPQTVGRQLGVDAVFLGRVDQVAERLNVQAELVRVGDGSLLWGDRYDREVADILQLQQQISREISDKLRPRLSGADRRRVSKRHTESTRAYHAYLKGRHAWNRRTAEGLRQGLLHFQDSIDEDPTYALAYTGLADCYNLLGLYGGVEPREAMRRARFAAERALEIDETLAQAHTSRAYSRLYYDWDWDGAERAFKRSLELNPNYATGHQWYHEYLTAMGRFEEQAEEIRKAEDLDPLSLIIKTEFGWGLYYARDYERAVRHLVETLERDPDFFVAHFILGLTYLQLGAFDVALAEITRAIEQFREHPFALAVGALGHALGRAGRADGARSELRRLQELSQDGFVSAYSLALIHIGLGEHDEALTQLEVALEERYDRLIFLKVEPLVDGLRDEPRFAALMKKVGLTERGSP